MSRVTPVNDSPSPPRWNGLDVLAWFLVAQLGTGLWYAVLAQVWPGGRPAEITMPFLAIGTLVLWVAYGAGPVFSTTKKGGGPAVELGARLKRWDLPVGVILGALTQYPVVWALYFPILRFFSGDPADAARELADMVNGPIDWLLLFVIAGVMAPLVEEMFFRGMLLTFLRRHLSDAAAVGVQAVLFAAIHFQALQFPGLLLMGIVSGMLTVRSGRLGPSWGMHVGFNWVTLVVLYVTY